MNTDSNAKQYPAPTVPRIPHSPTLTHQWAQQTHHLSTSTNFFKIRSSENMSTIGFAHHDDGRAQL